MFYGAMACGTRILDIRTHKPSNAESGKPLERLYSTALIDSLRHLVFLV